MQFLRKEFIDYTVPVIGVLQHRNQWMWKHLFPSKTTRKEGTKKPCAPTERQRYKYRNQYIALSPITNREIHILYQLQPASQEQAQLRYLLQSWTHWLYILDSLPERKYNHRSSKVKTVLASRIHQKKYNEI